MDILKEKEIRNRIEDIAQDIWGIYEARSLLCRVRIFDGFECQVQLVITQEEEDFIDEEDVYPVNTYVLKDDYTLAYDDNHLSALN